MSGLSSSRGFSLNLLFGAVVLANLSTGWFGWFAFESAEELSKLQMRNQEIVELQGTVTHLDEVLTMSVRMAVATGDEKWEKRYRFYEPLLDQAIKKLISLQPKGIKAAEETDSANSKLIEMEAKAFSLIKKNQRLEASRVLFSSEYENQKQIYSRGTSVFYEELRSQLNHEWEQHRDRVDLLKFSLLIFLSISFLGWVLVFQKSRRWSDKLGRMNERLDEKVKEQTSQLLNASKMSALGEMAAGVAHEINTPLATIGMRIEQMEECLKEGDIDALDFLAATAVIKDTVARIAKIINGLRFFAREGRGLDMQNVIVSDLIDDTLSFCHERFNNHGIRLRVIQSGSYTIECRAVEISQVLLNLLNNAFDAVEKLQDKWVRVEVIEKGVHIEISVTDSGGGISQDIQEKIMQPFFTTKEIGRGTGLGLSISNGIMMAHQGKIYVDSSCPNTKLTMVIPKNQNKSQSSRQSVAS